MDNTEDKDFDDKTINLQDIPDDDFDYLKEIEAIEAQEKELEEHRRLKKEELAKLQAEREREEQREKVRKKHQVKERKKEAEWLGEAFEDDVTTAKPPKKKKPWKGIVLLAIILLIIIGAGGAAYTYKAQNDQKTVDEFQEKVETFQSENLDGVKLGTYAEYFEDFMQQCEAAIADGDLTAISELNAQWEEMETTLTAVLSGKESLDALLAEFNDTFSKYSITEDYEETYEALKSDIEAAVSDCTYEQISSLSEQMEALATNLTAADKAVIQELKNEIANVSLDADYMTEEQEEHLADYESQVESYVSSGDYAKAISSLNAWKSAVDTISESIEAQKTEEAAKAESEAAARAKAQSESESRAESEALAKAQSESAAKAASSTSSTSTGSSSSGSSSSSSSSSTATSGDYILPESNTRYLTASDVSGLSSYELMLARNEIYARHGRKFKDSDIQAYFNSKSWYSGTVEADDFSASVFNDYEVYNIALIQSYE